MATYPDPNSIVDYLKTQDVDSSLQNRAQIYERSGFGSAQSFTGTADQNTRLLNALRNDTSLLGIQGEAETPISNNTNTLRREAAINSSRLDEELNALASGQANVTTPDGESQQQPAERYYTPEKLEQMKTEVDQEYDPMMAQAESTFNSLQTKATAATNNLIQSIRDKYNFRRLQQEEINRRRLGGAEKLAAKSGRARYLPQISQGILSDVEEQGIQRLAELDAEEAGLIAKAEQARTQDDLALLNAQMDRLDSLRAEKQDELEKLFKAAVDEEKAILDRQKEARAQQKQDFEMAFDLADRIAPAMFSEFDKLDAAGQAELLQQVAQAKGIDALVLLGALEEYSVEQAQNLLDARKTQADLNNIASQIADRSASLAVDQAREARLQAEFDAERSGDPDAPTARTEGFDAIKSEIDEVFEFGTDEYAGRDDKGDVPVTTYLASYQAVLDNYGESAALDFLDSYPPSENISPTRSERKELPTPIQNRL